MLYQQALTFLYTSLPMYQRIGAVAYKPDLGNTLALCKAIGDPQLKFKSVHVAGTNGKGSSSHMLASILQKAGYKTGLYTSPHLKSFTERIKINGEEIGEAFIIDFVERIKATAEAVQPSFFEITVAMAFYYFAQEKVDIAVVEVGLGGRLDSTNVITPRVSLITNISYDHKDILGNTLAEIAGEKAGIIKYNIPVVISQRQEEIENVFLDKATKENATLIFGSNQYEAIEKQSGIYDIVSNGKVILPDLVCGLKGSYQRKNIPGVLAVIDLLKSHDLNITVDAIVSGINEVVEITGLKGRWQQLGEHPLVICDIAHNEDGVREVLRNINMVPHENLHIVFGMVKDKDISQVLALLPKDAHYYFCQAPIPRAMEADVLAQKAKAAGLEGAIIPDVNEAIQSAKNNAVKDDLIFIGGSAFVVGDIKNL